MLSMVDDPSPIVRFQLALSLGAHVNENTARALGQIVVANSDQADIVAAALTSMESCAGEILKTLCADQQWLAGPHAAPVLSAIASQIIRQRRDADLDTLMDLLRSNGATTAGGRQPIVPLLLRSLPDEALAGDSPALAELRNMRQRASAAAARRAHRLLERDDVSIDQRISAIEELAFAEFTSQREILNRFLAQDQPATMHRAVLNAMANYREPAVAEMVLVHWSHLAPAEQSQAIDLLLRREAWTLAMLRASGDRAALRAALNPSQVARLQNHPSAEVRKLLISLPQEASDDRRQLFEDYRDAARSGGEPDKGKVIFEKHCAACHQVDGLGQPVGPNLASMASRGLESVLQNILEPCREVDSQYLEYIVVTAAGEVLSGMIEAETATTVILLGPESKRTSVLRVDIEEMQSTGKSLMPDGFEKLIDQPAMADLISFLRQAGAVDMSAGASK
jgi:putative heme-binding domain-containing protein